ICIQGELVRQEGLVIEIGQDIAPRQRGDDLDHRQRDVEGTYVIEAAFALKPAMNLAVVSVERRSHGDGLRHMRKHRVLLMQHQLDHHAAETVSHQNELLQWIGAALLLNGAPEHRKELVEKKAYGIVKAATPIP